MPAEIIKIDHKNYQKEMLTKAAKVLADGGLVAFPTETVYGLGVNANIPAAVNKLYAVKNSPENRPFAFHLAYPEDIVRYISKVPRLALRLMKVFWPGPLTLVLPDGKDGWIGLRVPNYFIAQDLIRLAKVSVIASSANIAEQTPPTDAQTVFNTLGDKIDIIIDAGQSNLGVSSTVVRVTDNNEFKILREGSISDNAIRQYAYKMILFVCSGNTCRSPMAMGLYRKMLADKMRVPVSKLESNGYRVISAGTSAIHNGPASTAAIEVMQQAGVDIRNHISQPVTLTMLDEADEIYVMTRGHYATLKEWAPLIMNRIKLLSPSGENIEDPIGQGRDGYLDTLSEIRKGLEQLIEREHEIN